MLQISGLTWTVTIGFIVLLLAVDLVLASVRPHRVGFREASLWSIFYVLVAIGFGVWFWSAHGGGFGAEYFAGYVVEKSLSVDNLFVFVIIMTTFAVPEEHQHKVLTFGIVLALLMRAVFIAVGAALLALFSFMFLLFGLLLIYTAVQLFRHRDEDPDVEDNVVVKTARRVLPIADDYENGKLFTRSGGRRVATPLFVVLAGAYLERTGDLGLIRELWPAIERALAWIDGPGDPDRDGSALAGRPRDGPNRRRDSAARRHGGRCRVPAGAGPHARPRSARGR